MQDRRLLICVYDVACDQWHRYRLEYYYTLQIICKTQQSLPALLLCAMCYVLHSWLRMWKATTQDRFVWLRQWRRLVTSCFRHRANVGITYYCCCWYYYCLFLSSYICRSAVHGSSCSPSSDKRPIFEQSGEWTTLSWYFFHLKLVFIN